MRPPLPYLKDRSGYVYIMALAAIAILALVLAGAFAVQRSSSDGAAELLAQTNLERDLRAAQASAVHLLLTAPRGFDTINAGGVLDFDGALIEAGDPISARGVPRRVEINGRTMIVRLIATDGLIGLDPFYPPKAQRFLERIGIDDAEASQLAARLADYVDEDDFRRLGGAELADYPETHRPPTNAPLRAARELCAVPGWETLDLCAADPRLMDLYFNVEPGASSQPALLPNHVLDLLFENAPGLSLRRQLLTRTRPQSFTDLGIEGWDELHTGEFGYGPIGTEFLILTHEPQAGLVLAARVRLTTSDLTSPYRTLFDFVIGGARVEQEFGLTDADDLEAFPLPEPP